MNETQQTLLITGGITLITLSVAEIIHRREEKRFQKEHEEAMRRIDESTQRLREKLFGPPVDNPECSVTVLSIVRDE